MPLTVFKIHALNKADTPYWANTIENDF